VLKIVTMTDDPPTLIEEIAENLGCEATPEVVGDEIFRLIEVAEALSGIAEELGCEENAHVSSYLEAVKELQRRADENEQMAVVGEALVEYLGLSSVSIRILTASADPSGTAARELALVRPPASTSDERLVLERLRERLGTIRKKTSSGGTP